MSRYKRFENELMAGGSVRDLPPPPPQESSRTGGSGGPDGDGENPSTAQGILGIGVIVALFAWLALVSGWMFVFAAGILVSVFLHESGHFLTARWTGMKATQFFIGFGPRIWSFQRGETEYGLRVLPLGAFVRIIGMNNMDEVPAADEARTYRQKSYPRRMLVISAGSIMHLLLAIVLLFAVFATRGQLEPVDGARVAALEEGGPAETAGLEGDDVIVDVGGLAVTSPDELGAAVRDHEPGEVVDVTVRRDGELVTLPASLVSNEDSASEHQGSAFLGVSTTQGAEWVDRSIGSAAVSSVTELPDVTWQSVKGVVTVLNPVNIFEHLAGTSDDITTRPTSLVGATQVSGSLGETQGLVGVVYLLAVLNIFIGVFNMFPLLPLDGGHAAIATYERVRERRRSDRYFADVSKMMPFALGVITVLMFLFVSSLYLDITEPLG